MLRNIFRILLVAAAVICTEYAHGQATSSPFSRLGIGNIIEPNLVNNQGMGGVGLSNGDLFHLNIKNPSLLPRNTLTTFSAGYVGEYQQVRDSARTETGGDGNLNYLILSFPIIPGKWTSSLGLLPYSDIDFVQTSREAVTGSPLDTALITETGSGGLNKVFWSNGYAFNPSISIGIEAAYIFGSARSEYSNVITTNENAYNYEPTVTTEIHVQDFIFKGGLSYRKDSVFNSGAAFQLGVTYEFNADLNALRNQTYERRLLGQPTLRDTLAFDEKGYYRVPQAVGIGMTFTRDFKWTAGFDLLYQQWSDFRDFNGSNQNFKNTLSLGIGGEYTPDASSVDNYLSRITYRVGASYSTLPYIPKPSSGEQVRDFGINFGWSLPVGRFSAIDMAFKVGSRGNVQENYIKENYYRIFIGFTFNDQWFIKRRYD